MIRRILPGEDGFLDLVPLIDCVFLLLLFFMLCGRLSNDQRPEQITVPPACTVNKVTNYPERVLVNIRAQGGPMLRFGNAGAWIPLADGAGWPEVRNTLDKVWNRAGKRIEKGTTVADAVLEVRADGDADWRILQELQQVAADSVDATTLQPRTTPGRPFTHLDFTVRPL